MPKFCGPEVLCIVSWEPNAEQHHIYTQKAHPELKEKVWNRLPVKHEIHNQIHSKGLLWAAQKYASIKDWLVLHDWSWDPVLLRWHHEY